MHHALFSDIVQIHANPLLFEFLQVVERRATAFPGKPLFGGLEQNTQRTYVRCNMGLIAGLLGCVIHVSLSEGGVSPDMCTRTQNKFVLHPKLTVHRFLRGDVAWYNTRPILTAAGLLIVDQSNPTSTHLASIMFVVPKVSSTRNVSSVVELDNMVRETPLEGLLQRLNSRDMSLIVNKPGHNLCHCSIFSVLLFVRQLLRAGSRCRYLYCRGNG